MSSVSPELIFVTGASGFLGSHVVLQLLEKGYRVRAAARGAKADHLKSTYSRYGERVEVVKITDIAHDQFPDAFVGVDAIIHVASPLAGRAEPKVMLASAVEGTLNVVTQGEKAGIKRIVVTSSIVTVMNPNNSYTDKDWNPVTKEMALEQGSPMLTYVGSKKFAELALWEWADKHPHVEITTLNPPFLYGPFTPHYPLPKPEFFALSSNIILYNLLFPDSPNPFPSFTHCADIRDVASAHIRALNSPPTAQVGRKRIVFSSPTGLSLKDTIELIAAKRSALKDRLVTATPPVFPTDVMPMDFKRVEEVLGMKIEDFRGIEETILSTVDALIEVESQWRNAGHEIKTPAVILD
ncbi:epimerase domain-containing protein [Favolaschia claudopus]|uniref:Epimerase domain-containing protein n=1 Tax=Favolaschia claudopus TaxID=2862362 RepID=A0AAW0A9H3_9AGAR